MILAAVVLACAVGLLGIFWDDILMALKKLIAKVKEMYSRVSHFCKVFVRKAKEGIKEILKSYNQVDDHWEEVTTVRMVSPDEVPKDILAKASHAEDLDITRQLELELQNAG